MAKTTTYEVSDPVFFTSDPHFGHRLLSNLRGFNSIHENDDALRAAWNRTVPPEGIVYVTGDFSFHSAGFTSGILASLNGTKHLVPGNHDRQVRVSDWASCDRDIRKIKFRDPDAPRGEQYIIMCHYALLVWERSHYGAWQLHGHSHGNLPRDTNYKRMDVGVDTRKDSGPTFLAPYSYAEVKAILKQHGAKQLDHHGSRPDTY